MDHTLGRDDDVERDVVGEVHRGHAAPTELALDLVAICQQDLELGLSG